MAKKPKHAMRFGGTKKKPITPAEGLRRLKKLQARKKKPVKLDRNTPSKPDAVARALDIRLGTWVSPKGLAPRPANTRWPVEIKIGKRHRRDFGEIEELALSFNERGTIIQPIAITTNDELIAGERRMKAWVHPVSKFRTDPIPVHVITIDNIVAGEWDENAHRKDFTPTEAVEIKKEIEKLLAVHARERQKLGRGGKAEGKSIRAGERASAMTGRKRRTLEKAQEVVEAAGKNPERFGKLQQDMDRTGKVDGPHKRMKVMQAKDAMNEAPPQVPMNGPYDTLSIDCPWPAELNKEQEAIDAAGRSFRPYPEMSIKSLCNFMRDQVCPIMAENCSVWLHVPNHHLVSGYAHHVIAALGFNVATVGLAGGDVIGHPKNGKPVTMLTWVKDKIGRGQVLRDKTEHVILLVRGKPVIDVFGEDPPTTILKAPRRDNSQKPEEFYRLVERVTPAKRYAAIFSTGGEGELWDSHGDQVGKHAPPAAELQGVSPQFASDKDRIAHTELPVLEAIARGETFGAKVLLRQLQASGLIEGKRKKTITAAGRVRMEQLQAAPRLAHNPISPDGWCARCRMRASVQGAALCEVCDEACAEAPFDPDAAAEDKGPELPFGETPACRVCGCTDDRKCPGGCAMVERTLCSKCIASQGHVVRHTGPGGEDGQAVATCSCGGFVDRRAWGDHHVEQDKLIRAHWQDVVAEATGIPPGLRRGERQPAEAQQ
jgi:N6-adenosine-specific RNA methylase IME4